MSKMEKTNVSLDNVRQQLEEYGTQIKEYLNNHKATVDTYKVSVEKEGEGLAIDVALRATIQPKAS